jgi:hypothetical protein
LVVVVVVVGRREEGEGRDENIEWEGKKKMRRKRYS